MTDPGWRDDRVRRPAAVLWDLDGTLVDTEPYWIATEYELAEEHGASWSQEHALELVGSDLLDSGRYIRRHMGIDLEPAQIVDRLLEGVIEQVRRSVPWRPGARELLADLRAHQVPCALVTMSYLSFVEPILAGLPDGSFDAVVTGDAVGRGKPDPEAYLTAAAILGVDAGACLAIEDSDTGARSAGTAGCLVLVVPNHVEVPAADNRVFASSLAGQSAEGLAALWSEARSRRPGHLS